MAATLETQCRRLRRAQETLNMSMSTRGSQTTETAGTSPIRLLASSLSGAEHMTDTEDITADEHAERANALIASRCKEPDAECKAPLRSGRTSPRGMNVSFCADTFSHKETLASIVQMKHRAAEPPYRWPTFHTLCRMPSITNKTTSSSAVMMETAESSSKAVIVSAPRKQVWSGKSYESFKEKSRMPEPTNEFESSPNKTREVESEEFESFSDPGEDEPTSSTGRKKLSGATLRREGLEKKASWRRKPKGRKVERN